MPFEYSALIGVVDLIDVVPISEELESNPWAWGAYCWRVGNARRFVEPIPAKVNRIFTRLLLILPSARWQRLPPQKWFNVMQLLMRGLPLCFAWIQKKVALWNCWATT